MTEELPPPWSTPVPEGWEAWEERRNIYDARSAAFHRLRFERQKEAEERGRQLLNSKLTEKQRADLGEHGWFEVIGSEGTLYRISDGGPSGNVFNFTDDGEHEIAEWCGHPWSYADRALLPYAMLLGKRAYVDRPCSTLKGHHYCDGNSEHAVRDFRARRNEAEGLECCNRSECQSDIMLSQMFKIQTDEVGWYKLANATITDHDLWAPWSRKMGDLLGSRRLAEDAAAYRRQVDGYTLVTQTSIRITAGDIVNEPIRFHPPLDEDGS